MALTLTLRQSEGFYVGQRRWYADEIGDDGVVLVGPERQRVRVTANEAIQLEPNVFVSEGFVPEVGCRLVLDAPRSICILRDDLYERQFASPPNDRGDPSRGSGA